MLMPANFFDKNPALDVPASQSAHTGGSGHGDRPTDQHCH